MKIIDVKQGSEEWRAWRKTVITATECSAIRGTSPWATAYKVWQRKLGLAEEQKSNEAMDRGTRLEPIIRARFIKKYGMNMNNVSVGSSEYSFLGASLDGLSDCGKYILEIKTGGYQLYRMAQDGIIPAYYMDQIQQQLLVTGAEKCFYQVGGEDEGKDIVIEVYPDPEFAKSYIPVAKGFWECVSLAEPPALVASDYKDMSAEPTWGLLAQEYRQINEQIKNLEGTKESYRKQLLKLCEDQNCMGGGLKVIKTVMRGRVDYNEIPEIKNVDIDKYRKDPTTAWKILVA